MNKAEKAKELEIRALQKALQKQGIVLRRENLARGSSFKVKSGECVYSGKRHIFIDRRLPVEQQLATLHGLCAAE